MLFTRQLSCHVSHPWVKGGRDEGSVGCYAIVGYMPSKYAPGA